MKINDLIKAAHQNALSKGWHDEPRSFGDTIALMHSELSEALEDYRNGKPLNKNWYEYKDPRFGEMTFPYPDMTWGKEPLIGKPCGIPSELADVVIRVFDACGAYGIDLEAAIKEKMAYNATRPHRHGGKAL